MEKIIDCPPGTEFVFKLPNGTVLAKAGNKKQFAVLVSGLPYASVEYHAKGKHFGPWFAMIGEKDIAKKLDAILLDSKTLRSDILRAFE
ncbi:MAG TPA: hypothetical protein PLO51_01175 [Candidatus Micrarchaeota archaeon]|nr:hypothetical protein [Candidatus Micrarchaeota archaeon]